MVIQSSELRSMGAGEWHIIHTCVGDDKPNKPPSTTCTELFVPYDDRNRDDSGGRRHGPDRG